jgi:hypothetical protein
MRALSSLGTFWPAAIRGGRLLARGQFRDFANRLFNESATVRAADAAPIRTGPPLLLAGHILRHGGYDHVVFSLLKGLIEAGVNVVRDPRAVLRFDLIPEPLRPSERRCGRGTPRLAATPPHLLHRLRPDVRTNAFTMWETDTLPVGAIAALNRCRLVIVPWCRWDMTRWSSTHARCRPFPPPSGPRGRSMRADFGRTSSGSSTTSAVPSRPTPTFGFE